MDEPNRLGTLGLEAQIRQMLDVGARPPFVLVEHPRGWIVMELGKYLDAQVDLATRPPPQT